MLGGQIESDCSRHIFDELQPLPSLADSEKKYNCYPHDERMGDDCVYAVCGTGCSISDEEKRIVLFLYVVCSDG